MLKKITNLQNIGLFQNGTPPAVKFGQVTLIYAENGRGKSTIAALLRACSQGNADRTLAQKTIDAPGNIEASLLFEMGGNNVPINFTNDTWGQSTGNIVVFDSEFVEQNVYSGHEVRSEQRQALLEFVLGEQAVVQKQKIEELTEKIGIATQRKTASEKEIFRFSQKMATSKFIKLKAIDDAQEQIEVIRKRIEAAKNLQKLRQRQDPTLLSFIEFDIAVFFEILGKRLVDVQEAAEVVVKKHLAQHTTSPGIEDWLSQGQVFSQNNDCPFCGQNLDGIELIDAYKSYFNQAYANLKKQVSTLKHGVEIRLSNGKIDGLEAAISTNTARIDAWKDQIEITSPSLALEPLRLAMKTAHDVAISLAVQKQGQPLEAFDSETDKIAITNALEEITKRIKEYNQGLIEITAKISEFKEKLSIENVVVMEEQIKSLELAIARYNPTVVKAIAEYQAAESERKQLDEEKTKTRLQLDELMNNTLTLYQDQINTLLAKFGAGFSIQKMGSNYQGTGEPRTEYMLVLRQQEIRLGARNDKGPHFGTVLSEGDKRTLALAFFLARIEADPARIASQILVLDDPISSFDRNRKAQTVEQIASLSRRCSQIIILSHEPYFVRQLRDKLSSHKTVPLIPEIIHIIRVQNDYSGFSDCDIDDICASDYYRHHRLVSEYVDGISQANIRDVAKAIRPLIEGAYHRRFPGILPLRVMFGEIINQAENAILGTPLSHLHLHIQEMREVNEYASRFHHDTNPSYDTETPADVELQSYAKRALKLVYKR